MLTDKLDFREEGFLGDEFFQSKTQETEYQCRIVQGVVERGVFTLDEALAAYEVSMDDYQTFIAANLYKKLQDTVNTESAKDSALSYLKVTSKLLHLMFDNVNHKDLTGVYNNIQRFSTDIEKEKIILSGH